MMDSMTVRFSALRFEQFDCGPVLNPAPFRIPYSGKFKQPLSPNAGVLVISYL
jgi:hypothetical protein